MPLPRDAARNGLEDTYAAMRVHTGAWYGDVELGDYADLDDAELPPSAAVHLADVTGRPIDDFDPDAPIPEFADQEVEHR